MTESNSTNSKLADGIPSVMKAAQQNGFGDVRDVLTLREDVPVPRELSPKQVLIQVHAASINPIDWKVLNGNMPIISRFSFPHIPGKDVAGVIVNTGSDVKRFKVGDKVYGNLGMNDGCFAEYTRGDESSFALKPNNLTMEEAAAVPYACEVSYQALFNKVSPPIGAGSKILIAGGSTSTGLYAIQLAKAVGAYVTTTCSKRNVGFLEKLGYNITQTKSNTNNDQNQLHIIDYNEKDFGQELKGENYDVVYDCVGGQKQWISAQQVLKTNGQFITIVGDDTNSLISLKSMASIGLTILNRKFWSVVGSLHHNYIFHFIKPTFQDLDDIRTKYIETEKVKPLIDSVFDLKKDGVQALYSIYDKSKSGKAQGKIILKIADEE